MRRRRFSIIAAIIFALFLAFCAVIYALMGNPLSPFDDRSFSATEWKSVDETSRARMAKSAIRRHLTTGLPEAQVVSLLGEADEVVTRQNPGSYKLRAEKRLGYFIGSWSLSGMDSAFLYVHLDAAGRVINAEVDGY